MEERKSCEYGKEKQRFIGIYQFKYNRIKSRYLVQQRSARSACSEATVTSSVPKHPFLHKPKVEKTEFKKEEIRTRTSFLVPYPREAKVSCMH